MDGFFEGWDRHTSSSENLFFAKRGGANLLSGRAGSTPRAPTTHNIDGHAPPYASHSPGGEAIILELADPGLAYKANPSEKDTAADDTAIRFTTLEIRPKPSPIPGTWMAGLIFKNKAGAGLPIGGI